MGTIYLLCAHSDFDEGQPTRYLCASLSEEAITQEKARYEAAAVAIDQRVAEIQEQIDAIESKRHVRWPSHAEFYEAGAQGLPRPILAMPGFTIEDSRETDRLRRLMGTVRASGIDLYYNEDDTKYAIESVPLLTEEPTP